MSEQPPRQWYPGQAPGPNAGPPQDDWAQQSQQQGQQQYVQAPQQYAQSYYGQPHSIPPAPRKNKALPWILAVGGVVVVAAIVGVVLIANLLGGGSKENMVAAPVTSASFQYPEGWVRNDQNLTVINEDGSEPAEHFSAINHSKDATALVTYKAGDRPEGDFTAEKIQDAVHKAIDQGLAGQLAASQDELIYMRTSAGFGCMENFSYTEKPAIVERDGMYGYGYGYSCLSYQGKVTGEYFVTYDSAGVSHRVTVEALDAEWAKNKATLSSIIDSLKPVV